MDTALMRKVPNPRLRTYVVWVPKVGAMELFVRDATSLMIDPRATHWWDGRRAMMEGLAPVLGLNEGQDAWDVYLVYGPKASWRGTMPPAPDFWMQKLGTPEAPYFQPTEFAEEVRRRLGE